MYLRAPWASGLGAVPAGYSCYCPNTIEASHKSLKGLLSGKAAFRNLGQLLQQVGDGIKSKTESGFYSHLVHAIEKTPKGMLRWSRKKQQVLLPDTADDEPETGSLQVGSDAF